VAGLASISAGFAAVGVVAAAAAAGVWFVLQPRARSVRPDPA
jgi:hypothetical protein